MIPFVTPGSLELELESTRRQLALEEAKLRTDESLLADFVPPPRTLVSGSESHSISTAEDVLRVLSSTAQPPDAWMIFGDDSGDVTMEREVNRLQTDREYEEAISKARTRFLQIAKGVDPTYKNRKKVIKGLYRRINSLQRQLDQLRPKPTAREQLAALQAELRPDQAEVLQALLAKAMRGSL